MSKLGYTWYPQTWWTSDAFFDLEDYPLVRYAYREIMDLLYSKGGECMLTQRTIEKRFKIGLSDEEFELLKSQFNIENDLWSTDKVSKRMSKAETARKNGLKGGAPRGNNNASKAKKKTTQQPKKTTQENNQNNPPYKREREREREYYIKQKEKLFLKEISIEQWAIKNKITVDRVKDAIEEFIDQKQRFEQEWQNDTELFQNFEFWLPKNLQNTKNQSGIYPEKTNVTV